MILLLRNFTWRPVTAGQTSWAGNQSWSEWGTCLQSRSGLPYNWLDCYCLASVRMLKPLAFRFGHSFSNCMKWCHRPVFSFRNVYITWFVNFSAMKSKVMRESYGLNFQGGKLAVVPVLPIPHLYAIWAEKAMAWRIPGMGEPGGLPSVGSHRVGHDWSDLAAAACCLGRGLRRKSTWQRMGKRV